MIKCRWPQFEQDELDAVQKVLESGRVNYWTGEQCKLFEQEFAAYHDRSHAMTLANGTLALELALYAFDIGVGDEVIVPSRTFIATASAVVACGAVPVVADVDRDSGNLTVDTIKQVKTDRTKAIIPVHLAGWPCEMDEIMVYAKANDLVVIEDCAQAHGAEHQGKKVGSFGDAAAFSFCQDKIMTTGGEGGILLLDDEEKWKKAWAFKDHGKSYDAVYGRKHQPGFRWLHESFGSNYRMTEMQAAIGRKQLAKLSRWVECRNRNASVLIDTLANIPAVRCPVVSGACKHAYYKFYCYVQPDLLKADWSRDRIISELHDSGIPCYSGSCSEIYLEKAFIDIGLQPEVRYSIARELGETSLMFLVDHTISHEDMIITTNTINSVLGNASRLTSD